MEQTTPRREALADPRTFCTDRRSSWSLRVVALPALLLVGCTPEAGAGPIADAWTSNPAARGALAPDATADPSDGSAASPDASPAPADRGPPASDAGLSPHDAGSSTPRDQEPAPRDGGPLPGADAGLAVVDAAPGDAALTSDGGSQGNAGRPVGVADCYSDFSKSHPAVLRQRDVFARGDYAARPSVIEELAEAAAAYPEEEQFVLLAGLMRLWKIVEPAGLEAIDVLGILDALDKTEQDLQRAYALCPTDHRIPGWLGPLWAKWGQALGDPEKLEAANAILQQGVARFPGFVTFTVVLANGVLPVDDPGFQRALDAIDYYRDRCNGYKLDETCINAPPAAHNFTGIGLYFGDTRAKARDREGALAWYSSAMQTRDWPSWPFRNLIEQRIQSIDQRIAAASTPDTGDDAPIWESEPQCSLCHRQ